MKVIKTIAAVFAAALLFGAVIYCVKFGNIECRNLMI